MHEHHYNVCMNHKCSNCKHDNKAIDEDPCKICYNSGHEKCYWEEDIHSGNDSFKYILSLLNELTDRERLEVFSNFCTYCGCNDPKCQCWNDD
jgi:hypothetical protein